MATATIALRGPTFLEQTATIVQQELTLPRNIHWAATAAKRGLTRPHQGALLALHARQVLPVVWGPPRATVSAPVKSTGTRLQGAATIAWQGLTFQGQRVSCALQGATLKITPHPVHPALPGVSPVLMGLPPAPVVPRVQTP